ncbi:RagB/SusD family nutrient uptake outer membrane protein [Mariniflexile rhizosphaerae]|nr:RagB/SusD family nutrient uptake outer membrane protein [Mariniflexile sp. TRM1-10]
MYQTRLFSKRNYWMPIPQAEIDINPDLVQNPYW